MAKKRHAKKKRPKTTEGKSGNESGATFDPRAAEVALFRLDQLLKQQEFESPDAVQSFLGRLDWNAVFAPEPDSMTALERAQDTMYDAWGASGSRRIDLARQALEISPDCADAYVLLAEESASTPEEALEFFRQGIDAGERALSPHYFEDSVGRFWGIVATRPYMRAREGFAHCLLYLDRTDEALPHFREMLRLNPQDNQGIRFTLLRVLLGQNQDDELSALLNQYTDDQTADWAYARALVMYRRQGESAAANAALNAAFEVNPFVPLYVAGLRKLPDTPPEDVAPGEESEAITYVANYIDSWAETPGALKWFVTVLHDAVEAADDEIDEQAADEDEIN
ncbi:MAG TPA: tetratricopeptide repeat protein [Blastocatellia bacterium]|nr:tetratricopeptide repeat protein [Blastocatellia bacterium]